MDILNRVDSSLHLAARGSKPRNPRLGQFALQLLGLLKVCNVVVPVEVGEVWDLTDQMFSTRL